MTLDELAPDRSALRDIGSWYVCGSLIGFDTEGLLIFLAADRRLLRFSPESGLKQKRVPTAEAAVKLAESLWFRIYGQELITKQKPFKATLREGLWHVSGTRPEIQPGGLAKAVIRQSDGKIIEISHGK